MLWFGTEMYFKLKVSFFFFKGNENKIYLLIIFFLNKNIYICLFVVVVLLTKI